LIVVVVVVDQGRKAHADRSRSSPRLASLDGTNLHNPVETDLHKGAVPEPLRVGPQLREGNEEAPALRMDAALYAIFRRDFSLPMGEVI
jgi:hypothetical protein